MSKRVYYILILIVFIFFSCNFDKPDSFEGSLYSRGEFQTFSYQMLQPDLDPTKYAQTHKVINIKINDEFYPFIIDTGDSNGTLKISKQVANEIGAIETGKKSSSKTFYGNTSESEVIVQKIRIGNLEIHELPCKIVEDSYFWPWNIRTKDIGIIGWKLLNQFNLLFDYQKSEIVFYDIRFIPDDILTWNKIELRSTKDILFLSVKIGESKKMSNLIIDSGGGGFTKTESGEPIFLDMLFPRAFSRLKKDSVLTGSNFTEGYIKTSISQNQNILENIFFEESNVPWFLKIKYDGILGWNFFRQYSLFFDNENEILYYKSKNQNMNVLN